MSSRGVRQRWELTEKAAKLIRERYDSSTKRIDELERRLGVPRYVIHRWASKLGVVQHTGSTWKAEELAYIARYAATKSPEQIAEHLGRTKIAVQAKVRALGLNEGDGYTLADIRDGFGSTDNTVDTWIKRGWLKGTRRAFDPTIWDFTEKDIRDFIAAHPLAFDIKRVDQLWFLGICFDLGRLASPDIDVTRRKPLRF